MIPEARRGDSATQGIEDRISNLPRHLIDNILDCMLIRDAARTSILSKTWKNIWETHPNILLVEQFINPLISSMKDKKAAESQYLGVVNSILLAHVGPILKFSLCIPAFLHLHDTPYPCLWIKQLPDKGVKILELHNSASNPVKDMPSYFFSCSELTKLALFNWKLNPPLKFRGFSNLIAISLQFVVFTTDVSFGTQVKHFQLCDCAGIKYLDSQLTNHGKSITFLNIARRVSMENHYALDYNPYTDRKKSFNLRRYLGNMRSIETLIVDAISLKFLDPGLTLHNHLISKMENLKTLELRDVAFDDLFVISNAFCLLRSMPILECLEIKVGTHMDRGVDIKLTTNQYLESLDCADISLNQLQNVTMRNFMGSRAELLFTKLLLASSPSLKRMTLVRSTEVDDPKEDFRIARELLQFPRKSPVEIFWRMS
ncbi:F-box domain-containing protein [Heracleum sosnowskyi]|uniref:F-box domain-containing protein n=1 Tax=Heracleum sosnowskyi TaxID=360622 RepID=A0AAD8H229_9APIA|nr:F-box domain-containing protein [Heracleum sosnowskyi]